MKNKFTRCCCPGEEIHIYSGLLSGQVLFDYFTPNRHRLLQGVTAEVTDIISGTWSGKGAGFGISNALISPDSVVQTAVLKIQVASWLPVNMGVFPFQIRIVGNTATHEHSIPDPLDLFEADRTETDVIWDVPELLWEQGAVLETPDFSVVLQEIISSPNWSSGQDAVLYLESVVGSGWFEFHEATIHATF